MTPKAMCIRCKKDFLVPPEEWEEVDGRTICNPCLKKILAALSLEEIMELQANGLNQLRRNEARWKAQTA